MDRDSLAGSVRFEPALTGRLEMTGERDAVFIPEQEPRRDIAYTFVVASGAADRSGLSLGRDYTQSFTADLPWLELDAVYAGDLVFTGDAIQNGALIAVSNHDLLSLSLRLRFSACLSPAAAADMSARLSLSPYFPPSLPPIALSYAGHTGSDTIALKWEGIEAGSAAKPHYYRLFIPGGTGGVCDGNTALFKESRTIYFEVKP
jgi:hypothetical protein